MSMWTCEEHGADTVVVYYGRSACPICALQKDLDKSESNVSDLESEVDSLKDEVGELKDKIRELEASTSG